MSILSDFTGKGIKALKSGVFGDFAKDIGGFLEKPMGQFPCAGKSFLMQKLEGGEIWNTLGLGTHDFAKWDKSSWDSGGWQDRVGAHHYGRQWEDFKEGWSGANLVDKRLGLEGNQLSWDQFNKSWGAGAWQDRLGTNMFGETEGGGGGGLSDTALEEYTTENINNVSDDDDDIDDESTVEEALTEKGDSAPPSAMNSRAVGWASNIRRSLGEVGEDLYRTRGKKASILTRRGMLG